MATHEKAISAAELRRLLGISYKAAWTLLHRLRRAMVPSEQDRLRGLVEVDAVFVAKLAESDDQSTRSRVVIAIAVEVQGNRIGLIRIRRIPDTSRASLITFILGSVQPGSMIRSPGWMGSLPLKQAGYQHEVVFETSSEPGSNVYRSIFELDYWLWGTRLGGVSLEHFDSYLDEYAFRFNLPSSCNDGDRFRRLLECAMHTGPIPFPSLARCSGKPGGIKIRHISGGIVSAGPSPRTRSKSRWHGDGQGR
jgi:hypothetical protein